MLIFDAYLSCLPDSGALRLVLPSCGLNNYDHTLHDDLCVSPIHGVTMDRRRYSQEMLQADIRKASSIFLPRRCCTIGLGPTYARVTVDRLDGALLVLFRLASRWRSNFRISSQAFGGSVCPRLIFILSNGSFHAWIQRP